MFEYMQDRLYGKKYLLKRTYIWKKLLFGISFCQTILQLLTYNCEDLLIFSFLLEDLNIINNWLHYQTELIMIDDNDFLLLSLHDSD